MIFCKFLIFLHKLNVNLNLDLKNRIYKIAKCKQDCNYGPLLSSNYTNDTNLFIRNVIQALPQSVASSCATVLSKFMSTQPVNAQNILSNLSKTIVF